MGAERALRSAPGSIGVRDRSSVSQAAHPLLRLQQSAGNAAVTHLVQRSVQRDPSTPAPAAAPPRSHAPAQTAAGAPAGPVGRRDVDLLAERLKTRQGELAAFLGTARKDVDDVRRYYSWVNDIYTRSYANHAMVVAQASATMESQQAWADAVFGLATGVAVGLLAEVAVAAAGIKLTYEILLEIAGEVTEAGISAVGKVGGPPMRTVDGLAPALKSVRTLEELDRLNQSLVGMAIPGTFVYSEPRVQAERISADLRVGEAGGARSMSDEQVTASYNQLVRFDGTSSRLAADVARAETWFAALRGRLASRTPPTDVRTEQDIWIPWIAKQPAGVTSFFQLRPVLATPVLLNHFVDIGLAARGAQGGRLGADTVNSRTEFSGSGVSSAGPLDQLVSGAKRQEPALGAYWTAVFLQG